MQLEKIEMSGFKSFADKTVIEFDKGVTAVVGPNGSGKSNLSEAIKWVLGEQSAKSLRGKKMDDVIFAGSQTRKPVNIAEVNLHINNEDGKLEKLEFTQDDLKDVYTGYLAKLERIVRYFCVSRGCEPFSFSLIQFLNGNFRFLFVVIEDTVFIKRFIFVENSMWVNFVNDDFSIFENNEVFFCERVYVGIHMTNCDESVWKFFRHSS